MTWARARYGRRCGRCGQPLDVGAAVLVITIGPIEKVRGECCEGDAPPELAPYVRPTPVEITPTAFRPIQSIAHMLPLDWRRRQAGDDE